jgi:uncharacterized protein YkwD
MVDLDKLIELHNQTRKNSWFKNLNSLSKNEDLMIYAQNWANHMAKENRLYHGKINNIFDLGFTFVGENIASGQKLEETVMSSWLKSRSHKKNILNSNYTDIGCGYAITDKYVTYWCVCFGKIK